MRLGAFAKSFAVGFGSSAANAAAYEAITGERANYGLIAAQSSVLRWAIASVADVVRKDATPLFDPTKYRNRALMDLTLDDLGSATGGVELLGGTGGFDKSSLRDYSSHLSELQQLRFSSLRDAYQSATNSVIDYGQLALYYSQQINNYRYDGATDYRGAGHI